MIDAEERSSESTTRRGGALPGNARALVAAANDRALKNAMIDEARKAEEEMIGPLLQFRNFGVPLPNNWTTQNNGAAFGTDYFTRTAVGKSNILANKPIET